MEHEPAHSGDNFLNLLSAEQRALITAIPDRQKKLPAATVEVRQVTTGLEIKDKRVFFQKIRKTANVQFTVQQTVAIVHSATSPTA